MHAEASVTPESASSTAPAAPAWRTFRMASAAGFLVLLDTTAVVAAYAPLRAHFSSVSSADLSWTLNAYTVLFAALLVPAGRLADLMGRKRIFLHGLAPFVFASALCAWAPGFGTLIAARALQAVGGGVNGALRQMGGAAGAALAVALIGSAGANPVQFQWMYAVLAGLGLLAALLCLPVQTRPGIQVTTPAGAAP